MKLRAAVEGDAGLLLTWRNDPVTRTMSGDTAEVTPEGHATWLAGKLADPRCELWIGEVDGDPVAQVRLDLVEGDVAVVSISVAREARGRGYAEVVLDQAMMSQRLRAKAFRATVRRENEASRRLFERAGFTAREQDGAVVVFERAATSGG